MLAPNSIIIWPFANADIPAGFERVTELDGLFIKGAAAGVDPGLTGGAETHTHTSPTHAHSPGNHGHYVETSYAGNHCIDSGDPSSGQTGRDDHRHVGTVYGPIGSSSSVAVTYGSMSNRPPYRDVIFIRATGWRGIPAGAVVFTDLTTLPTGFSLCDGTVYYESTPDEITAPNLIDKFLRGADTDGDGGATGGSTTNVHSITHGHTGSHGHSYAIWGRQGGNRATHQGGGGTVLFDHDHNITLNYRTDTINDYVGSLTTAETVQPAYKKLVPIINTSLKTQIPKKGIYALWLGTIASIPKGWQLADGNKGSKDMRGLYLKGGTTAQIASTGGSNTHTHAAQSHSHTCSSQSHTHSLNNISQHGCYGGHGPAHSNCLWRCGFSEHTSLSRIDAGSITGYDATTTTANSSSNEPPYMTVAFIRFQYFVGGILFFSSL